MTTQTLRPQRSTVLAAVAALLLAACGGGSSSSTPPSGGTAKLTRGEVTAKTAGSITVNGVVLTTGGGTTVRVDDNPGGLDDVQPGDVVNVRGNMDDRNGDAAEIEVEHGVEGQVDDKGTDFIVVGGTRVQVDDSTHLDDRLGGFDGVGIGSVVMVSGVPVAGTPGAPDDKGGLRASRIDRSPRQDDGNSANDDDFDVKGFVSALGATTFELRSTPDAVAYYVVNFSGIALPVGVSNGAYVEVHSLGKPSAATPPVITASSVHLEDAVSGSQVEVEGYVTSISVSPFAAGGSFRVGGVKVQTSASTQFLLGDAGNATDVVVGAKVEAEGSVDASGVLVASKVKFRPGVRITAIVQNYTGTDMTLLGIPVQIPSWLEDKLTAALANNEKVEVRGNPTANGLGVVAYRIDDPSGGGGLDRVFLRAMVTAKVGETLTVFGFQVTPPASTNALKFSDDSSATNRAAWFAAIEPGHTVVKLRASSAGNVNSGSTPKTWIAEEIEIEGND